MSTAAQDDVMEFGNDPGEETWPFTMVHDWILFVPLSPEARHLYLLLRSMLNDADKENSSSRVRRMSVRQLCLLMGAGLRPTEKRSAVPSERSVRRWRSELAEAGLVRVPDEYTVTSAGRGTIQTDTSRSIYVRRYPAPGSPCWKSAFALLKAMEEAGGDALPETPVFGRTELSNRYDLQERENVQNAPVFERTKLSGGRTKLSGGRTELSGVTGSDLAQPGPKNVFKESSEESLSPYPLSGPGDLRESEKMIKDDRITRAAQEVADALGCELGARARKQIVAGVSAAIGEGLPPSRALAYLKGKATGNVHSPDRLHASNAQDLPRPRQEDAELWLLELCGHCDAQGRTDDEDRVSKDPTARDGVCLHGQPDPWDDPAHRAEVKAFLARTQVVTELERKAAVSVRERREQSVARRRESQRAKGIDCSCTVSHLCAPCSLLESRKSGPDLPASAYDGSGEKAGSAAR